MVRKWKILLGCILTISLILSLFATGCQSDSAGKDKDSDALPSLITLGGHSIGSATYIMMSGVREVIEEHTPMKARVIPYVGEIDGIQGLKDGTLDTMTYALNAMGPAHLGWGFHASPGEGPVNIRYGLKGNCWYGTIMTTRSSGIKTFDDLKGKRVAMPPEVNGWGAISGSVKAYLAFAGMSVDDIIPIPVSSYPDGVAAVLDGRADAAHAVTATATCGEIQASPDGIYWIPLPHDNEEGWKRLQEVAPFFSKATVNSGYVDKEQLPLQTVAYPTGLFVLDKTPDNLVYELVKALDLGYDKIKGMHPQLAEWKVDKTAFEGLGTVLYHNGAIKYFKEKGIWTEEVEKQHQEQLAAEAKVRAEWKPIEAK